MDSDWLTNPENIHTSAMGHCERFTTQGLMSDEVCAISLGLCAALEIMVNTPAVANIIRQGKLDQLENSMQGGGREGMITMDTALKNLMDKGDISGKAAYESAIEKSKFEEFKDITV